MKGPGSHLYHRDQAGERCHGQGGEDGCLQGLLELAGVPADSKLDGHSLTGLLADPDSEPNRHAGITYLHGNHAVRQGRWLYIRYRDGGEELYDRDADPHELANLAGDEGLLEVKRALAELLPRENAPAAPLKREYVFDPAEYSWLPKP